MEKLKLLLIALLIGFTSSAWAQNSVSGVVTDSQGLPVPGVNVSVKGTTIGAATDFDGNYLIKATTGDVIVFSYLGFKTRELTHAGQSTLNVQLEEDSSQLDEVVVIGYGSVKRTDLTGAVSSLGADNITKQKKTDVGQALKGQVAGVDVRTLSNKPGASLNIRIRGNTAITNSVAGKDGYSDSASADRSKPLYVVDGVFFEDINILNPADIQQMDILKDASATAIYGSRGANGVVIITTKNGIEGRTQFTYEATLGFRTVVNQPDYFNGDEYVAFVDDVIKSREWKKLFSNGVPTIEDYNNIDVSQYINTEIRTTNTEADNAANRNYTNWIKDYQKTGIQTSHNLGMSGGSDGLVYNGSLGYLSDEGVIGIEGYDRYTLSLSMSKKISDKFTVGIKSYLSLSEREEGSKELYRSTQRLAPTLSSSDSNGNIILFPDDQDTRFTNPYYDANGEWTTNTKSTDVIANVYLDYKPADWISFKTQFASSIKNKRYGEYRGLYTKSSRNDPSRIRAYYNTYATTSYTWDNIMNLNFDVAEGHNLQGTFVSSIYSNEQEYSKIETRDFDTDSYSFYNTGAGTNVRTYNTNFHKETLASFTARLKYNINDKYLFTFSGRYDGSSKLAVDNKWAFFPAGAFAWKVIDEDFMQNADWVSNLKLRVSYGESGNDSSVKAYESLAFLSNSDYLFGSNPSNGVLVQKFNNYGLTWERSKEYNVGVDFSAFENRIGLSLELYTKTTEGSIISRALSPITGFGGTTGNFGSIRNRGVEVTLNTRNIVTDNFRWSTNFNFSKNKNEILELDGELDKLVYGTHGILQVGEASDAIWSYEKLGIWQLDEAAEADVYNTFPGAYKFKDQNDDGVIDTDDKVVLGQTSPDWVAGMTNSFNYKNFDFSVHVYTRQGSFGHSEFNSLSVPWQNDDAKFNKVDVDYWTPNNPDSENPALEYGANAGWYYTDFDFVRIGNIGLGYEFSDTMLDKLKMSSLRLSLDVQNPFTFTDYYGSDPETGLQNNYNGGYLTKTVLFGLKLSY